MSQPSPRHLFKAICLIVALAGPAPARADEAPSSAAVLQQLDVGASVRHFNYLETAEGGDWDNDEGTLPGLDLGYTLAFRDLPLVLGVSLDGVSSSTEYASSQHIRDDQRAQIVDTLFTAGAQLLGRETAASAVVYTGLGYHYWRRGDQGMIEGFAAYRENYSWWILPVGLNLGYDFGDRLSVALDLQARFAFAGGLQVYSSQIDSRLADTSVALGSTVGGYFSLPVQYRFTSRWGLVATPWFEYSAIGQSAPTAMREQDGTFVKTIYEPSSRTYQFGTMLGASLRI